MTKLHGDPRPIKDSEFQRRAIRTIIKYLTDNGYGPITPQTFRGLSYRTFQDIFKFLHQRVVPGHVYVKDKFEDEFIDILKSLRYPLADTISPKALYSIAAPHSYPVFLALLLWMTKLCQVAIARKGGGLFTEIFIMLLQEEAIMDNENDQENDTGRQSLDNDEQADELSLLFYDYTSATYSAFMDGADEFSGIDAELKGMIGKAI